MTTAVQDRVVVSSPYLTASENARLQECVDAVARGEREFYVLVAYRKQTEAKPRVAPGDYAQHPALAKNAHKGWLVAAALNKQGEPYLHVYDEARALEPEEYGHTRLKPEGILSFEVLRERPGPLGQPATGEPQQGEPEPQPQPQGFPGGFPQGGPVLDPQALMLQSQAMMAYAHALMLQAMAAQAAAQKAVR